MKSLIVDCSAGMSVFVLDNEKVYSKVDENQKKHTDDLLVSVDDLLDKAELKIKDIESIGVCVGPGSFTGVRVAVSMVKGLSVSLNQKIFAISNFDVFDVDKSKNYVCVLDGFSNFVYVRFSYNNESKEECIDINELVERIKHDSLVVYVLNEKTQNKLKNYEIDAIISKNNIINAFLSKVKLNQSVELNQISPVYLRASQAEIERNKKLNLN